LAIKNLACFGTYRELSCSKDLSIKELVNLVANSAKTGRLDGSEGSGKAPRLMPEPVQHTLSEAEKLDWLRLIRSENVGPITFFRLLERFGSARAAIDALPDLARRGGAKAVDVCVPEAAAAEMAALAATGARLVAWDEPDYPAPLAAIDDPPPLIAVLGDGRLLQRRAIAVVGARNASINGQRFARALARDLGDGGLVVVSGLARGIDAAAHEGALSTGTVAVLGGGIDVVYPKENATLYEKIREDGVLVSEVAPGTEPQARHFPRRNRLIAGVSLGVVVVEASLRSGSLITARLALEQGREVFAVPGSALDPRARGTNDLIRQGATLTETADDVFRVVNEAASIPLRERKDVDSTTYSPPVPNADEVARARDIIVAHLSPTPVKVDEIIRSCHFSPAVVAGVLLELELAGRLERHPGNQVSLLSNL
jgi:DNA processing protein